MEIGLHAIESQIPGETLDIFYNTPNLHAYSNEGLYQAWKKLYDSVHPPLTPPPKEKTKMIL